MDFKSINGGQETLCIKVNKVYDWVTRQVDVPLLAFNASDLATGTIEFDCENGGVTPDTDPCAVLGGTTQ